MEADPASAMWSMAGSLDQVDGRTAFAALRAGDAAAKAVVERYLEYLAEGLANFINIFQPEVIALGGGVSHGLEADLLQALQTQVLEQCFGKEAERRTKLVRARLGNDAGIIGAALLGVSD